MDWAHSLCMLSLLRWPLGLIAMCFEALFSTLANAASQWHLPFKHQVEVVSSTCSAFFNDCHMRRGSDFCFRLSSTHSENVLGLRFGFAC
jgi:hypothetical protein